MIPAGLFAFASQRGTAGLSWLTQPRCRPGPCGRFANPCGPGFAPRRDRRSPGRNAKREAGSHHSELGRPFVQHRGGRVPQNWAEAGRCCLEPSRRRSRFGLQSAQSSCLSALEANLVPRPLRSRQPIDCCPSERGDRATSVASDRLPEWVRLGERPHMKRSMVADAGTGRRVGL